MTTINSYDPHTSSLRALPQVDELLEYCVEHGASDIMFKNQQPPIMNVDGSFRTLDQFERVTDHYIYESLERAHPHNHSLDLLKERLKESGALNFRTSATENAFRFSVGLQSGKPFVVARPIPRTIPTIKQLELMEPAKANNGEYVALEDTLAALALRKKGIVIITGQTGSGKSTTCAAMLDHINTHRQTHIITVEDPVEFVHRDRRSYFNQREVGPSADVPSFAAGVEQAMRQAPGVILVGEIRNKETLQAALQAAETGHMVYCTLHTKDAPSTIQRIYGMFDAQDQAQVQVQLASSLAAVISQQLVPRISKSPSGRGRQLVMEIMVMSDALRGAMKDRENFETPLRDGIRKDSRAGSLLMDAELARATKLGLIAEEHATLFSVGGPDKMRDLLRGSH